MAAKFINRDFIWEARPGEGILVLDTNLQGFWECGEARDMQYLAPNVYETYKQICLHTGNQMLGRSVICKTEDGYEIALLFTKKTRKDKPEDIIINFENALKDLLLKIPSDKYIYSPVFSRKDFCFAQMLQVLNKLIYKDMYNWFICRKGN